MNAVARRLLRGSAIALVASPIVAAPALATPPGKNGTILFERFGSSIATSNLVTVDPADTTGAGGHGAQSANQITSNGSNQADITPAISPDGTRVAYAKFDTTDNVFHLHVMDINGQNDVELSAATGDDDKYPAWTPTGHELVFTRGPSGGGSPQNLWLEGVGGENPRQLTTWTGVDSAPEVSPSGNEVAWAHRPDGGLGTQIMVGALNAPGSAGAVTNSQCANNAPTWSPDGTKLAFSSQESEVMGGSCAGENIEVVGITGNLPIDLTSGAFDVTRNHGTSSEYNEDPVWSPDGTKIAWMSARTDPSINPGSFRYGIWLMNADGTNPTLLSNSTNQYGDQFPSWATIPSPTEIGNPIDNNPLPSPTPPPTPTPTPVQDPLGAVVGGVTSIAAPPTPAPTPVPTPQPTALAVAATKIKAKKGAASVPLTVPGAGSVTVSGTGLTTAKGKAKAPGALPVTVHLTAAEAKKLKHAHKVKITITVRFTPTAGKPTTTKSTITITS